MQGWGWGLAGAAYDEAGDEEEAPAAPRRQSRASAAQRQLDANALVRPTPHDMGQPAEPSAPASP